MPSMRTFARYAAATNSRAVVRLVKNKKPNLVSWAKLLILLVAHP